MLEHKELLFRWKITKTDFVRCWNFASPVLLSLRYCSQKQWCRQQL